MAILIQDLRTLVDEADSLTGWTGSASPVLFSTDPGPVEATDSIGMAVSEATEYLYHTLDATVNISAGELIYVWVLANGTMDSTVNGGIELIVGDSTNEIGYHLAGSDVAAFRHSDGPVGWQCLVLDTINLPVNFTAHAGAEVSLDFTVIDQMGAGFITLSKALGGAQNCFTDIIRYGNQGIEITDGSSGVPSNWTDIATEDRSTTTGTAYGICRELGSGLFGVQGAITFGDADNTTATFFADTNKTIIFEDRGLDVSRYVYTVRAGGVTGTTTFKMGTISGTEKGVDGCSFICPSGVGAKFDASNIVLQSLLLYGTSFTNFDQGMLFSADATNGPNHDIFSCRFIGCSQIDPGKVDFKNNEIASTTDANGGILLDADGNSTWSDLSFISDGTGHAIYITEPGNYTFTNYTYTGYGADDTTDAAIYNNSGGEVTISPSGGDVPTVRNGASATTIINNAVDVGCSGVTEGTSIKIIANETIGTITTGDVILEGFADNTGELKISSFNYEGAFEPSGLDVIVRARNSGISVAAIAEDNGTGFTDETPEANSNTTGDMTLLPATPALNDAYYFGHNEKFSQLKINVSTELTWSSQPTIIWEYWNGAWVSLSGVSDGTNGFETLGENIISYTNPGDWAITTINSQGPFYYIRARLSVVGTITQIPKGRKTTLDTTKYLPYNANRIISASGLADIATWAEDNIVSF